MMPQTESYEFMLGSSDGKPTIKKKKVNFLADFKMTGRELNSRKKTLAYFSKHTVCSKLSLPDVEELIPFNL